jgi:hypothetical protein
MPEYMLELYASRSGGAAVTDHADRAGRAAERLPQDRGSVRYLRSIFVPEDETCFLVFEAESAEDVRRAASLARLPANHVVEALRAERR